MNKKLKTKAIRQEGFSRVIAITDIIPKDWNFVTVEVQKVINGKLFLLVTKKS